MNKPEVTPQIALAAADIFIEPDEDLISVPAHDTSPYPASYVEFGLASAAISALIESDISPEIIYQYPEVIDEVEAEIKILVEDWKDILLSRARKAIILNNYGKNDSFNPN